jgi:prevent-host-death family protein
MKTVSARRANHDFSKLPSRVERGEEILITKRSKPVALLSPYHPPRLTPERQAAINRCDRPTRSASMTVHQARALL